MFTVATLLVSFPRKHRGKKRKANMNKQKSSKEKERKKERMSDK